MRNKVNENDRIRKKTSIFRHFLSSRFKASTLIFVYVNCFFSVFQLWRKCLAILYQTCVTCPHTEKGVVYKWRHIYFDFILHLYPFFCNDIRLKSSQNHLHPPTRQRYFWTTPLKKSFRNFFFKVFFFLRESNEGQMRVVRVSLSFPVLNFIPRFCSRLTATTTTTTTTFSTTPSQRNQEN